MIKFIDLFCGLGGIRIGLENALKNFNLEGKCVLSSEIKKGAIKSYSKNFNEENFQDITKIKTEFLDDFDILLAGFPCQAFSNAGKRMGFEDTRGTLFFEVARILNDKKPKAFILENVEGLISHDNGKTFKIILETLNSMNYSVSWKILNSSNFNLVQNRKRVYIVGLKGEVNLDNIFNFPNTYSNMKFKDVREYNIPIKNSKLNNILREIYNDLSFLAGKSIKDKRGGSDNIHSWDLSIKGIVTKSQKQILDELVTKRRYKKWAIENGTAWFDGIPLSIEQIKTFVNSTMLYNDLEYLVKLGYLKKDYPKDYKIINNKKEKITRTDLPIGYAINSGKLSFEFNYILNDNEIIPTIVATDSSKIGVIEKNGIRQLTAIELKRIFGFPEDYQTSHLTESELFDLFGNSVTINVIEAIAKNLLKTCNNM